VQRNSLKGNVSDGMPLVQANVLLKKANKSIVTDGNYIIKDLAAEIMKLLFPTPVFELKKEHYTY
jgi:hypothetical protein